MSIDATQQLYTATHQNGLSAALQQIMLQWFRQQQLKIQISRERRELAALPENLLKDIGVDPHAANRESKRARSDIPCNRKP